MVLSSESIASGISRGGQGPHRDPQVPVRCLEKGDEVGGTGDPADLAERAVAGFGRREVDEPDDGGQCGEGLVEVPETFLVGSGGQHVRPEVAPGSARPAG
jgi:hypothetical protein